MEQNSSLIPTIAAALCGSGASADKIEAVKKVVQTVYDAPAEPSCEQLKELHATIEEHFPSGTNTIALVYGGATKVKGYVFESAKLPEIRGASALLDRINTEDIPRLWEDHQLSRDNIIFASGGNVLAFAPSSLGETLAAAVERAYTRETLTANSVAVSHTFSLLELRYGLNPLAYWVEEFLHDWNGKEKDTDSQIKSLLAAYYYGEKDEPPEKRFFRRKTFGELVTLLATKANRRRESRASDGPRRDIPHFALSPFTERCESNGFRPAVVEAPTVGSTESKPKLSEAAALKRYVGQRVKQQTDRRGWFHQAFKWEPDIPTPWDKRFLDHLEKMPDTPYYAAYHALDTGKVRAAHDVSEIGQASSPGRYIGLIYADGNNMGRYFAKLGKAEAYRAESKKIEGAATSAVFTALARHLRPVDVTTDKGEKARVHPFEIITIGGDDLLLIVPGSTALHIALTIGYEFERSLGKPDGEGGEPPLTRAPGRYRGTLPAGGYQFESYQPTIGLSAGVVIAQENAPIFFLHDLAEELLKSAKGKAKKQPDGGGTIDFMVLKSVTMVSDSIRAFRESAFGTGDESSIHLTARPYTWLEFQGLLATAGELCEARFPRSQIYRLRQRLFDAQHEGGIFPSVIDYLHTRTRGLKKAASNRLAEVFDLAWHAPQQGVAPWIYNSKEVRVNRPADALLHEKEKEKARSYETIWPDLTEIYEFVSSAPREEKRCTQHRDNEQETEQQPAEPPASNQENTP
jgi:CRISPR-associated protein Cmr2